MTEAAPTRQRLLDAGLRLFAERGFDATSVGDIEAAVGLQPRRGALYKHFPSKQALLEAAVHAHLDDAESVASQIADLDLSTALDANPSLLRPMITALGRWFLDEMDRLEDLTRLFEHDAHRLASLAAEAKTNLVDLSYRTAATLLRAVRPDIEDPEALAVIILGSLVAVRRTVWTYRSSPLNIDDDRVLSTWTTHTLAALDASGEVAPV